ncbi:MAG: uracil phosphoribosyltransferase [Lachnospiraceae bacterium]|nr:uracil phosphoribosyltransferase [Lachnospiraceae bacterium]
MSKVEVLDHPLIQHKLGILRKKETGAKEFRHLIAEISMLMCYEATRDLPLEEIEVETPICKAVTKQIKGKNMAVVPILRAGLGMIDGILTMEPTSKIGHVGVYRDADTKEPIEYYCKLPLDCAERDVLLLDPLLATGASVSAAVNLLKEKGIRHIRVMSIVAAPEGIYRLQKDHPDVEILTCAIDEKVDENGYIVPGVGDAGDRMFGTR